MALGTKFRIEGTSDIFGKVTVNIKLDGYTGAVIDLDGVGRNWVELKIGDNSNDISNPILPGKLTVQFYVMADFATTELGRSESFTYYVEALDGLGDLIWAGWAIPDEYKEAYHNTPYIATLVASDGLEELKNVNYFVQSGKVVLFDHIQNCLTSTQLDLPFFESINIYSNGMDSNAADSPLKQAQVTYNSFLNISETPNKYDVLRSILQPFFARIYQYRGWRIENILEKRGSYVVREYDSAGAYVGQETFNPLVKFDTDYADYRAFIQKTGQLSIRPSLNNAEVYFNTVEPAEETATGGFQKAEDWTSSTELVEWTAVGSNITIEQVTSSFDGNEFAVKIPGKRSSLEQTNYLESNSYPINSADYETINIEFAHYADYPSIIILGSKPILYFEIIFTETAAPDSYNWTGSAWELIPTGQPRKRLRIDFSNRQRWTRYSVSIDRVPADGDIKFRFYKLIKSGSEGVTELRLTAWKSNLVIQEPRNAKILLEYASGQAITTYKGPSFAHIISDGLIVNAAGVMDVDNVLTDEWSRRGITDELNIRRLFLLQWLSLNATPTELLSGTIHQKGEVITPMSVVKDKDAVSSVRYVMQSWNFSLSNGIGAANYRQILLTDTNINAFQDFVDSIRFGDYFSFTTISPIFIFGAPGLSDGANTGPFELPNFTLNGDVRGQLGQSELTPAAIVNKARLDLVGLSADQIVFNAVKDSPDQENMTNLRLSDLVDLIGGSQENGLISGGIVQWTGNGYEFNISSAIYRIGGNNYASPASIKTLATPDATNNRIDVFAVDVNNEVVVITGTPASTPIKPQVNPATQLELTSVIVTAASTTPTLTDEVVYDENTEWTGTSSGTGTANFASTTSPYQGTVSIETTNIQDGFTILLDNGSDFDLGTVQTFGFQIKLKAAMPAGQNILFSLLDASNNPISKPITIQIDKGITTYQFSGLILSSLGLLTNLVRKVRFGFLRTGGSPTFAGYFLDIVKFEGGINPPVNISNHNSLNGLQGGNASERYHLTKDKAEAAEAANAPTSSNPFATIADLVYPEAVERENNTVLFDKDYVIGNATARTGNILFDFTNAKLMGTTMMLHNSGTAPTFPAQAVKLGGEYELSANNYIYFQLTRKTASSEIVLYTISQVV